LANFPEVKWKKALETREKITLLEVEEETREEQEMM
jgi:hypothetical protein